MASGAIIATVITATMARPDGVKMPPWRCAGIGPATSPPSVIQTSSGDTAASATQATSVAAIGTISGRRATTLGTLPAGVVPTPRHRVPAPRPVCGGRHPWYRLNVPTRTERRLGGAQRLRFVVIDGRQHRHRDPTRIPGALRAQPVDQAGDVEAVPHPVRFLRVGPAAAAGSVFSMPKNDTIPAR